MLSVSVSKIATFVTCHMSKHVRIVGTGVCGCHVMSAS